MLRGMLVAKRVWWVVFLCSWLWLGLWPAVAQARSRPPVEYELAIPDPTAQYVEVSVTVDHARRRHTEVAMPAWTPGSYLIRDFARHVYGWRAESLDGKPLEVERTDKQTWRVDNRHRPFRFRYRVWADDLGVRTSYVDDRFAFLNGAGIFVYVVGQTQRPARVKLAVPEHFVAHTALTPDDATGGVFVAPDYDVLVDSPLLLGAAEVREFQVDDTRFEYVFLAPSGSNADVTRLAEDARKIVEAAGEIMGGFPFERYTFLMVADPVGGGGLEHANSTGIVLAPWGFDDESGYTRAQRVVAHEFFHAWNVKRIHDARLGPFDYTREVYSDLLWFHEGVTTTMTSRLMVAAGHATREQRLEGLAGSWNEYMRRPGRNAEPITHMSRDAWIKGYRPANNHRNDAVSYYTKGSLIGEALDLELRLRSAANGQKGSIEGMLRRLWEGRRKGADRRPISPRDLVDAASAEAGRDMTDFFARFVDGTDELELPALLAHSGVKVTSEAEAAGEGWAGLVGDGKRIRSLDPGAPGAVAGLMLDDEPIAIDGTRVDSVDQLRARIAERAPGTRVEIAFFRRGRLERRTVTLAESPYRKWSFEPPAGG